MRTVLALTLLALASATSAEYLVIELPPTIDAASKLADRLSEGLGAVPTTLTPRDDGTTVNEWKTAVLNGLAEEGWTIVAIAGYGTGAATVYLERPDADEPNP